jgi:hypothetical protein
MNTYAIPEYLNGMVEPKYVERVTEKKNMSENNGISLLGTYWEQKKITKSEYLLNFSGKNSVLFEYSCPKHCQKLSRCHSHAKKKEITEEI